MDIRRRQQLIHDQNAYSDAISTELARLLERPLTEEEKNVVSDAVVCQGFMSSETDANSLHSSADADEAIRYLAHASTLVRERRSEVIGMILRGVPPATRNSVVADSHPNLIAWQKAILETVNASSTT